MRRCYGESIRFYESVGSEIADVDRVRRSSQPSTTLGVKLIEMLSSKVAS
jgi:hypothetical protein